MVAGAITARHPGDSSSRINRLGSAADSSAGFAPASQGGGPAAGGRPRPSKFEDDGITVLECSSSSSERALRASRELVPCDDAPLVNEPVVAARPVGQGDDADRLLAEGLLEDGRLPVPLHVGHGDPQARLGEQPGGQPADCAHPDGRQVVGRARSSSRSTFIVLVRTRRSPALTPGSRLPHPGLTPLPLASHLPHHACCPLSSL